MYELKKIMILMILFSLFSASASAYTISASGSNINPASSPQGFAFLNRSDYENKTLIADFLAVPVSGVAPLTVQFEDNSSNNTTAWEWDFNSDGVADSIEEDPVYEFANPGNYNVTLTAVNGTVWGNITKINYIIVGEKPEANFTAAPREGKAPLTIQFTDTSTGNVTSWFWDFGDGSNSTSRNPKHKYTGTGTYNVNLTVSNAFGSDNLVDSINLSPTPAPVASFTLSTNAGKVPPHSSVYR